MKSKIPRCDGIEAVWDPQSHTVTFKIDRVYRKDRIRGTSLTLFPALVRNLDFEHYREADGVLPETRLHRTSGKPIPWAVRDEILECVAQRIPSLVREYEKRVQR